MASYRVALLVGKAYEHGKGWEYGMSMSQDAANALLANDVFDSQVANLTIIASEHQAAARLELTREDDRGVELIRAATYDGEDVFGWHAAYQEYGQTEMEDRYYITTVHLHAGYYTFIHPDNQYPKRKLIHCHQSRYDLKEMLGDEYPLYELRS